MWMTITTAAKPISSQAVVHSFVRWCTKILNLPIKSAGSGGRGGIRTHGTLAGTPVFKTGALNHSATLPLLRYQSLTAPEIKNEL